MREHLTQLAIHSYYVGELDVGLRACERLLRLPLDWGQESQTRSQRTWYTKKLDELLTCRFHRLEVTPAGPNWTLFNPSVVATTDGWLVNVRSSNYRIVNWSYVIPPGDGNRIRTENLLVTLDPAFNVQESKQLKTDYIRSGFWAEGMEDIRINPVNQDLVVSTTLRDLSSWDGACRIATARIEEDKVVDLKMFAAPGTQAEKNWMPIHGQERWIYSCHHEGHVALIHAENGRWVIEKKAKAPLLAKGFRGGSQVIPVTPGKWLAAIHEVAMNGNHRVYEHRFVIFDEYAGWSICAVSPPFVLRKRIQIEFVAGLARKNDKVVMTFGEMDEFAWLVEFSMAQLMLLMTSPD
jgi:predicted GH43/DUF377 family glycosyl hydrolase